MVSKKALGVLVLVALVLALLFLVPSFTGSTVTNVSEDNSAWIAFGWFVLGVIFVYFYFRRKTDETIEITGTKQKSEKAKK